MLAGFVEIEAVTSGSDLAKADESALFPKSDQVAPPATARQANANIIVPIRRLFE